MRKHVFVLILNNRTYETYYRHGWRDTMYETLKPEERIIREWVVIDEEEGANNYEKH